ncbi:Fidgetin 1 [Fusarium albosuccineum]|uniref:Fidgetin 1 n=1 Tax=Fusarium albosuccineum TaxID=1237068 RepID=A0A8H4LQ72_9HYPO|nr:Fidgetin 1 [Fusarium albosuccineum]
MSGPVTTKLYLHTCDYNSCPVRWSKFPNHKEDQAHLDETTAADPIIHRHTFSDNEWNTESFTIQSPAMREIMRIALADYQDLDPELENWTFRPPFMPIVHRWDRLRELCESTGDESPTTEAATRLMEFLRPIVAAEVEALARTRETGNVTSKDLWQIFAPIDLVVTKFYDVEAVCRVMKYELVKPKGCGPSYWAICMEYLDWNGSRCGYATLRSTSWSLTAIGELRLTQRGRKFEALRGYHFQSGSGTKILLDKPEERPIAGRVVIDAFAYYSTNDIVKPDLAPLNRPLNAPEKKQTKQKKEKKHDQVDDDECGWGAPEYDDGSSWDVPTPAPVEEGNAEMTIKPRETSLGRSEELDALTDDQCLVATPWVKGLDLKTKEWAQFCVDDLSPITWNDAAFENLVLPGTEKQLAWEFVENKSLANSFDDFIQDKGKNLLLSDGLKHLLVLTGRGIIILMFGPPGVGKKYTAEAVAEKSRVPLYSMSAGDLGTQPKEVEKALDRALGLCGLWNAMLLLDEADVFLGARTDSDLSRNELVSGNWLPTYTHRSSLTPILPVFLTKLEYYTGCCFLTTNRTASIDPAFQSRVDLFLPYKDLTVPARKQVWQNFIIRAGGDVSPEQLDKLAEIQLNGREIKNLIKSAHLLSLKGGGKMQIDRLLMLAQNRVAALGEMQNY